MFPQDAPVQPHHSTIALWHVLFGERFFIYKLIKDFQFREFSFVQTPADPYCRINANFGVAMGGNINEPL